jgi:hypothetical protein
MQAHHNAAIQPFVVRHESAMKCSTPHRFPATPPTPPPQLQLLQLLHWPPSLLQLLLWLLLLPAVLLSFPLGPLLLLLPLPAAWQACEPCNSLCHN